MQTINRINIFAPIYKRSFYKSAIFIGLTIAFKDNIMHVSKKCANYLHTAKYICNKQNMVSESPEKIIVSENFKGMLDDLPRSIDDIHIKCDIRNIYDNYKLYNSNLSKLNIGGNIDNLLYIPPTLKQLTIDGQIKHPLEFVPFGLEELKLGNNFNDSVDNILLNSLKKLHFGDKFDKIFSIPNALEELYIGDSYNKPLLMLPSTLRILNIGSSYNYPLILSRNLEILILGNSYNQPFKKSCWSLKVLIIGDAFCQDLIDTDIENLFPYLEKLVLGNKFNGIIPWNKMPNLKEVTIGNSFNKRIHNLPENLQHLYLGDSFNSEISELPKNLRYLHIGDSFDKDLCALPNKLEYLSIGKSFYKKKIRTLPISLRSLHLGYSHDTRVLQCIGNKDLSIYINGELVNHPYPVR